MFDYKTDSESRAASEDAASAITSDSDLARAAWRRMAGLTPTQRDLYLHALEDPGSTAYNIGLSVNLGAGLDAVRWEAAVRWVAGKDDIAATCFLRQEAAPIQVVAPDVPVSFELADLGQVAGDGASLREFLRRQFDRPFDLRRPPLLRNLLVKATDGSYTAALFMPHILMDRIAMWVFLNRVEATYEALLAGAAPAIEACPSFYDCLAGGVPDFDSEDVKRYWRERLRGVEPLQLDVPAGSGGRDACRRISVGEEASAAIRRACRDHGQRLASFFLAAFALSMRRYADHDADLVLYSVLSGRPREHLRTLGCFYQVVPYAFGADLRAEEATVADLLSFVAGYRGALGPREHISVAQLDEATPAGSIKCFYNYSSFAALKHLREQRAADTYEHHPCDELHLLVVDLGSTVRLELHYNDRHFIDRRYLERLERVCAQMCDPARAIATIDILLPGEREESLREMTPAQAPAGPWTSVAQRVAAHALRRPEAVAVVELRCSDATGVEPREAVDYRELNRRANQLAHRLRQLGFGPDDLIAVLLHESVDLVLTLLGILKAGCAYLPLDPSHPRARIEYLVRDAGARLLVTTSDLADLAPRPGGGVLCLDAERGLLSAAALDDPLVEILPEHLAYVIYTSGSTGAPKGVLVTHGNLARLFEQTHAWFEFDQRDVWTLFHSCAFDFSVWELWGALVHGGRLVVVPWEIRRSPERFHDLLRAECVTVLNQTPAAFYQLMRHDERRGSGEPLALRVVIFGGEALNIPALKPWVDRHGDSQPMLVNMYGITETTVHVTYRRLRREDIERGGGSVIGIAIPDLRVYLLDTARGLVPPGLPGEIYVGGAGVAAGYLGRPALTCERFLPDPFSADGTGRMYRSGDRARRLADGDLEFLGRADDQVKISGYRIEPREIEAALIEHAAIAQAAVVPHGTDAERRLVAYLVLHGERSPTVSEVRDHLIERVPQYMVPAAFVTLKAMPLTPNGKVDRRALPAATLSRPNLERAREPPRSATEEALAGIVESLLATANIGVHDSFFELGGNSLAVMQLVGRVRDELGVDLSFRLVFQSPTVADLAGYLDSARAHGRLSSAPALTPVPRNGPLPMSYSQERVWFLLQLDPANRAYESLATVRFRGNLDVRALQRSLSEIVGRHEIYRTTFTEHDGRPSQLIHPPQPAALSVVDLSCVPVARHAEEIARQMRQAAAPPFMLDRLPLVRWSLLRLSGSDHVLVHFEHHLLHDGWSFAVFVQELVSHYRDLAGGLPPTLPAPRIQFADFAVRQRQWLTEGAVETQLAYWRDRLADSGMLLKLPLDRARPARPSYRGDTVRCDFDLGLSARIERYSRVHEITRYMTLLTAFATLLWRYSGQTDIVIGSGVANRRWPDTEALMGMLINNLSLRLDLTGDPTVAELLRRVRCAALEAYDHQDVPFDQVVQAVNPARRTSHSPIFQVVFSSYDGFFPELDQPGLAVTVEEALSTGTAKFDLNVIVICRYKAQAQEGEPQHADTVSFIWEYSTDLFDRATIEHMAGHYRRLLEAMLADPDQRISALPMLSDDERRRLLVEWSGAPADYPREATLHELYARQARATPDAVALEFDARRLTYKELNRAANRLAHRLCHHGIGPESPVAVCMERSLELVVSLLGILKAGGHYVPLDPDYPAARIELMLEDSRAPLVLTQERLRERLPREPAEIIAVDASAAEIDAEPDTDPGTRVAATHLAYLMYTSGSTGTPKGTCIEHRAVVRLVRSTNYANLGPEDVFLQFAPVTFDASTFEIWGSLLNGAKLVVFPPGVPSLAVLGATIRDHGVSTLWLTAGLFHQMVENRLADLQGVRQLLAGGDVLSPHHVRTYLSTLAGDRRLICGYGPTENTTFSTCHVMDAGSTIGMSVPIGRPVGNTTVYILDAHLEPVPVGVPGELYVGGDGLARGYLEREALTRERFIADPFSRTAGSRLYRTGDHCRWRADGTIEFIGRQDHQVKVRGYRVELGEIEVALNAHPSVGRAVVLCREDTPGDKRLVAYVTGRGDSPVSVSELRSALRERLPDYMLPSAFVVLDRLPLTPIGKVDRAALPRPEGERQVEGEFVAPRGEMEERVARIWREVLGVERIGVYDDFFDLGGHSLLILDLVRRIERELGVRIEPIALFQSPNIAGLMRGLSTPPGGTETSG